MHVTSQDVALASLVVAAIGIIIPWRTRVGDHDHASVESAQNRAHERTLAADERTYVDRRDAYLDIVALTVRVQVAYNRTYPVGGFSPGQEPPSLPDEDELMLMDVRMAVLGSDDVRARIEAWDKAKREVQASVLNIRSVVQRGQEPNENHLKVLQGAREVMQTRANEIDEAIRADMNRTYS